MVQVLDSTLREGEQTPGVFFPVHAKLAIAKALERVGVGYIEAGHPSVAPSIKAALTRLAREPRQARLCAHARSLQGDVEEALECGVDFVGIFYCVSKDRLGEVFKRSLDAAIEQITSVIRYVKQQSPETMVRYTPEDTVRSEFSDVIEAAAAACAAGADLISVADTTGHMIPHKRSLYDFMKRLKDELGERGHTPLLAVHCHDDRGLALANALDAYAAGVDVIDATVLGLGERAGLVDLATLLTVLSADFGEQHWDLSALRELYDVVSVYSGLPIPATQPIMGQNAFTHCAGVHTHAATKNAVHYQSLDPELVGRTMEVSLDHMSGLSSVQYALERIEVEADRALAEAVLTQVKGVGEQGRVVEGAELRHIVDLVRGQR